MTTHPTGDAPAASERVVLKLKRAWCYIAHWHGLKPDKGLGWVGWWCPKCGYRFFAKWEDR